MTPLERVDEQIRLLEDAIVIHRVYLGETEIINSDQIQSDLQYLRDKREQIIKWGEFNPIRRIRKFKFLK